MTPEAQRITIAEACGFWDVHWYADDAGPSMLVGVPPVSRPKQLGKPDRHIPDYLNDLNAMHEAEMVLDEDQWLKFSGILGDVTFRAVKNKKPLPKVFKRDSATASQRAEAFLRTIGKWNDA